MGSLAGTGSERWSNWGVEKKTKLQKVLQVIQKYPNRCHFFLSCAAHYWTIIKRLLAGRIWAPKLAFQACNKGTFQKSKWPLPPLFEMLLSVCFLEKSILFYSILFLLRLHKLRLRDRKNPGGCENQTQKETSGDTCCKL